MSGHTPWREIRDRDTRDRLIEVVAKALHGTWCDDNDHVPNEMERLSAASVVDALGVEHYTDVTRVDPVNGGLPLYRIGALESPSEPREEHASDVQGAHDDQGVRDAGRIGNRTWWE